MIKRRTLKLYCLLTLLFSLLLLRIYSLMNTDSRLSAYAEGRKYSITLTAQRGDILDRNGLSLLSGENDTYAVCAPPLKGGEYAIERLAECSTLSAARISKKVADSFPFALRVSDPNIRLENVATVELPRRFPSNGVAAHLIGYTSDGGSKGVCGLEAAFDEVLKSDTAIAASVRVDRRSGALSSVSLSHTGSGGAGGITLTLDKYLSELSRTAFESVEGNECGAVVVMEVKSGDILVSESFPAYDPNNVAPALSQDNSPLLNRVLSSFNLGSTFKIVTAAALIEEMHTDIRYNCRGYIHVGNKDVGCHLESGHGSEGLSEAFANSCNPYFIKAALTVGRRPMLDIARRLDFGIVYRLADGITSASGSLPDESSLAASAALANFSIGQGELMATPLQVAVAISAVANDGIKPSPRLVTSVFDELGDTVEVFDSKGSERVFSENTAATLRELMINAVENGTGKNAKPKTGGAGGKTATAQTGSFVDGKRKNNAWFAGFYPAENPQYAIVVLAENGSSGSVNAAPVFKTICDYLSD